MDSAITSKGRVTIPKVVRDHLRLKPGDRVKFFVHPDGSVVLLPRRSALALRGSVKPSGLRITIKDMSEVAADGAVERTVNRRHR